jgi:uncharacterized membrane protein HdeD (DUF308 family)
LVELIQQIIEILKLIAEGLKLLINYLISEPAVAFAFGFLLMLTCIREVLSRGKDAPFSAQTATIIAVALTLYGAYTVAERLPLMGKLAAYAVIFGIPLALVFRFLGARS